ncbi:HAMP domain-containing protein [Phytomonospora sp. NPDC050363]|uniref:HAMP domain-containing protein n=1 Tax=Phytomonospora sp. NPDC050363 TaxID=3155642 RepID=UPI0033E93BDD
MTTVKAPQVRRDENEEVLTVLAEALARVESGDFSVRIPRGHGLGGEVIDRFNSVVAKQDTQVRELTRMSRVVGREGQMTERFAEEHLDGGFREAAQAVNSLIDDIVRPTAEISRVIAAVAEGDLSQRVSLQIDESRPLKGEFLELARTVNKMVELLRGFAVEVTRVAREVGTEGKLGGQAAVPGVSGTWNDLTVSVNLMASNLTDQVRNISQVATAVAKGDLSQKITVLAQGEIAELAGTINSLTDTLRVFANEVTRVAQEVGTEGKLGGQAAVPGVAGTWKDLTVSVNSMASNLTDQVRNIAQVATAVATGDLSQKITVVAQGEILELKNTVNTMVDQLSAFADEVTRVAREVGTDGKLGGQAKVTGVSGTWRDLTENVNQLASNLTDQVRNIAQVTTAVAKGDLSQKITVDAQGEIAELKNTVNRMVDQLSSFGDEVTRVAREVGTEGKLGGQAHVRGVSGIWKDLTDNVNLMASNLTAQVRNIAQVATAVAKGDLTQQITVNAQGEIAQLKNTVNKMVDQLSAFAAEVTRVAREVGTEGKLGGQAQLRRAAGTWRDLTDNVNLMASNLTNQVRNIADVATAVAKGDLSQKITVDAQGEILELKSTVNRMVDQLSSFADEVTRVAREVGTDGKLGGQAHVHGVSGIWKDLTDNVNSMASNLTDQVRNIAQVTTAVAEGDLSQKITVNAQGEIAQLKNTVNRMVSQLSSFGDEVTRVAREVGVEGKLGGQAQVEDVSGIWKDLTDNVNQLARTLTNQLRAVAEVSTAVTRGDMTQRITVDAQGEVAELTGNINQMIEALLDTTVKNAETDWMNSNLARVSELLQGQRDIGEVCRMIMTEVTPLVDAQVGAFFLMTSGKNQPKRLVLTSSYGYVGPDTDLVFAPGESLVGQAATSRRAIRLKDAPSDYLVVRSGLGRARPADVVVLPVLFEGEPLGVIEFGSLNAFSALHLNFLDRLVNTIGIALNTILANRRTEELLTASQKLAQDFRDQSEKLQRANEELQEKAQLLTEQNQNIELKNREIDMARLGLEDKARQLTQASQYKSEFLANISHELRTPLNSLLLLARLLAENAERNLSAKQIEFARTIHNAGSDLLVLIDDILDLSKIEAGRMAVDPRPLAVDEIAGYVEQAFRPQAEEKGLEFSVERAPGVPDTVVSDAQRLQQILRNLVSNAVKFTDTGKVSLTIAPAPAGMIFGAPSLDTAETVYGFIVSDTGIGVPDEKLALIFEAFQQADGTTSRKYGGTGLGLSISKSLARLLGGLIMVESQPGKGSTFTLFVPDVLTADKIQVTDELGTVQPVQIAPNRSRPILRQAGNKQERRATPSAQVLENARVLIVDDDVRNVFALTSALELHGMTVLYADNGADGIGLLTEHGDIDIVLMDSMMPDMDGNETTREIRRIPEFADLPVVFLTAKATPGDRDGSLKAGASAYITKPVDLDELLDLMAYWVEGGDNALAPAVHNDEVLEGEIVDGNVRDGRESR